MGVIHPGHFLPVLKMPAISASFPGKIILFGEHAVVYNSHAIAIPVHQVCSRAVITPLVKAAPGEVEIVAPDIDLHAPLSSLQENDPIGFAIRTSLDKMGIKTPPAFSIRITSDIPIAAGMGSGASVSCSIARSISTFLGKPFSVSEISSIAFEVEKLHHGTPSGVDNTVIAYGQPVYFKRGDDAPMLLHSAANLDFIIADTGIKARTVDVVADVRKGRQDDPARFDQLIDGVENVVSSAYSALNTGDVELVGSLMNENQALLLQMGVSHPKLDAFVSVALENGAIGAKLSGAGRGGNMIALVPASKTSVVRSALENAGAVRLIHTTLAPTSPESD